MPHASAGHQHGQRGALYLGREEDPHTVVLLSSAVDPVPLQQPSLDLVSAARPDLRRPLASLDRTIDTIDSTHGVEIFFFWFLKLIVVARVTDTRYR